MHTLERIVSVMKLPIEVKPTSAPNAERAPAFVRALEEYAQLTGLTEDELINEIGDLTEETSLGGPECLSSQEVAQYCHDQTLPVARHEHLMRCEDCRALVAASLPRSERLHEFLSELSGTEETVGRR